jgi:hypothetical protein
MLKYVVIAVITMSCAVKHLYMAAQYRKEMSSNLQLLGVAICWGGAAPAGPRDFNV